MKNTITITEEEVKEYKILKLTKKLTVISKLAGSYLFFLLMQIILLVGTCT